MEITSRLLPHLPTSLREAPHRSPCRRRRLLLYQSSLSPSFSCYSYPSPPLHRSNSTLFIVLSSLGFPALAPLPSPSCVLADPHTLLAPSRSPSSFPPPPSWHCTLPLLVVVCEGKPRLRPSLLTGVSSPCRFFYNSIFVHLQVTEPYVAR